MELLIEATVKYGPIVLVIWYSWRDYEREKRFVDLSQKNTENLEKLTVKAIEAIADCTVVLKSLADEVKRGK